MLASYFLRGEPGGLSQLPSRLAFRLTPTETGSESPAPCLNAIYEKRNPSGVWPKWLTVALDIDAVTYGRVYMFSDSIGEGPNSLQVITPKPRCRVLLPI